MDGVGSFHAAGRLRGRTASPPNALPRRERKIFWHLRVISPLAAYLSMNFPFELKKQPALLSETALVAVAPDYQIPPGDWRRAISSGRIYRLPVPSAELLITGGSSYYYKSLTVFF